MKEEYIYEYMRSINEEPNQYKYVYTMHRPKYGVRLLTSIAAPFLNKHNLFCLYHEYLLILPLNSSATKVNGEGKKIFMNDIVSSKFERRLLYHQLTLELADGEQIFVEVPTNFGMKKWHQNGFELLKIRFS